MMTLVEEQKLDSFYELGPNYYFCVKCGQVFDDLPTKKKHDRPQDTKTRYSFYTSLFQEKKSCKGSVGPVYALTERGIDYLLGSISDLQKENQELKDLLRHFRGAIPK